MQWSLAGTAWAEQEGLGKKALQAYHSQGGANGPSTMSMMIVSLDEFIQFEHGDALVYPRLTRWVYVMGCWIPTHARLRIKVQAVPDWLMEEVACRGARQAHRVLSALVSQNGTPRSIRIFVAMRLKAFQQFDAASKVFSVANEIALFIRNYYDERNDGGIDTTAEHDELYG